MPENWVICHYESKNTPNVDFLNVPLYVAPTSYLAANWVVRCATGTPQRIGDCSEHAVLAAGAYHWTGVSRPYLHYGDRGRLQNVSSPSVLFESSRIFLQCTWDTEAKNDGPEFWNSNSVIFENFLKFSKKCRAIPLRPIWTIMVAAKLDHSRVLVTKFHQNWLTLKGRSASQRHTDRQTRLKIMALQVCNRANRCTPWQRQLYL